MFNWFQIEPSKGNFDWGGVDSFVNHARARGLKVFATLGYSPGWANGGQPERVPPTNVQDWYDFVYAVAVHFNGRVDHWRTWNEPNDPNFFGGSWAQYETIASTGRTAINQRSRDRFRISNARSGSRCSIAQSRREDQFGGQVVSR